MDLFILVKSLITGLWSSVKINPLMWAIFFILMIIGLLSYFFDQYKLAKSGIEEIDRMSGEKFEQYLKILLSKLGYSVKKISQKGHGDFGGDLIISKDGIKTVVQAKRWDSNVGIKAVQEANNAKVFYDCDNALVITNSHFTQQAQEDAYKVNVELWERDKLITKILESEKKSELNNTNELNHLDNKCVICNKIVSDNVYQFCLKHQDKFKGQIYCWDDQQKLK